MSRFKLASHADKLAAAKAEMTSGEDAIKEEIAHSAALMLNIGSNGSGTTALVKTEAYNKWLAANQEKNPFIGKSYMQRAEEYEHDSEVIKESEAIADNEAAKLLEKGEDGLMHLKDDINPNVEEDGEELDGAAAKFVNLCVINKVVGERIGWEFDAVMEDVIEALNEYHADDLNFELPDDLEKQVHLSIEAAEYKYQLAYNKAVDESSKKPVGK